MDSIEAIIQRVFQICATAPTDEAESEKLEELRTQLLAQGVSEDVIYLAVTAGKLRAAE